MVIAVISRRKALGFRQHASYLDRRLPRRRLADAAFAGLQDSSPRSAVLSLHARVLGVSSSDWEDSQMVQIWGPRGADYVVPKKDVGVFTLGRMPRDPSRAASIESAMARVAKHSPETAGKTNYSGGSQWYSGDLRVASITGRLRIRWDGSRISWWTVERPSVDLEEVRLELARRFLRCLGPSTPAGFGWWSGVTLSDAKSTLAALKNELSQVELEGKNCWILSEDLDSLEEASTASTVRLLPQGDPYLCAADRRLFLPEDYLRAELWPKSVWPGALFVRGELAGTWRRQLGRVVIRLWRKLGGETRIAVEDEVQGMPIESKRKEVRWEETMNDWPQPGK